VVGGVVVGGVVVGGDVVGGDVVGGVVAPVGRAVVGGDFFAVVGVDVLRTLRMPGAVWGTSENATCWGGVVSTVRLVVVVSEDVDVVVASLVVVGCLLNALTLASSWPPAWLMTRPATTPRPTARTTPQMVLRMNAAAYQGPSKR
jgi:hypothetical protein